MRADRVHKLLLVEFYLNRSGAFEPFSVRVWEHDKGNPDRGSVCYYDVDYCHQYEAFYYHMSGGGGGFEQEVSGIYWASGKAIITETPCMLVDEELQKINATRRLPNLPQGFEQRCGEDALNWLDRIASEDETIWCGICEDHLPSEALCSHVWYCEESGCYVPTDTEDDGCRCNSCCRGRKYRREALVRAHNEKLRQRVGPLPLPV